jgi:hypothetical protein
MGEGVSRREFDRARDTIQPLLKSIRGIGLGRAPYHSVGSYHRCSIPSTSRVLNVRQYHWNVTAKAELRNVSLSFNLSLNLPRLARPPHLDLFAACSSCQFADNPLSSLPGVIH